LIAAGTCVAIVESIAGVVTVEAADVELLLLVLLLLLLPHPASTTTPSAAANSAATSFLM
jgi:hypothetical protein